MSIQCWIWNKFDFGIYFSLFSTLLFHERNKSLLEKKCTIVISNIYQFTSYFLFLKKQQVMEKLIGKTSWLMTKKCDFSQPDSNDVVKVEYRWRKKLKNFLGKNILKQCSRLSHFETKMVLLKKWTINRYIINYLIKCAISRHLYPS